MSNTIDHRVVEMEFDNKQFERNVSTTMSSIDKLKQSLNFNGTSKGMSALSDAASNTGRDFSEFEATACKAGFHLEDVWHKVSTVFEYQIARRIVNAGKNIASALTIDPIKTGFSEYETQMNAVQTILANTSSKGKTLDDVNDALDTLNAYADKTIYNFTEMTRNIGTFTAAGVDLDTSVSAIKGIANLAAVSGSTSQQASTAMYQLSQAMASGTVKLMDWNSVVNAGMGGQVFQDALKETAKVHGVAIDDIIKKNGSFRESLSEGWLTTEILTDTLAKFTGDLSKEQLKAQGYTEKQIEDIMKLGQTANDAATKVKTFTQLFDTLKEAAQSGWTQTWEILVGDFEEAKELLTNISNVIGGIIGESADARNELLENWKVLGGRDDLVQALWNIFDAIGAVVKPIKEAFEEIIPPMTAENLASFTEGLKNFTEKLIIGEETAEKLKRTFKGVFAVVDIFRIAISAALKAVGSLFGGVGELGGSLLGFTANIGDLLVAFRDFIQYSGIFDKVFRGVATVVKVVIKIVSTLIDLIVNGFASDAIAGLSEFLVSIGESMSSVGSSADGMQTSVSSAFERMGAAISNSPIFRFFSSLWNGISKVASALFNFGKVLIGGFVDKLANANFETAMDILHTLVSGGLAIGLTALIASLAGAVKKFGGILDSFSDVIESFKNKITLSDDGDGIVGTIRSLAISILILTASLLILSSIDSDKLSYSIAVITALFADLIAAMSTLKKLVKFSIQAKTLGTMMIMMSVSILLLASALKKIGSLDQDAMINGLIGVTGMLLALSASIQIMSKSTRKVKKGTATTLLAISVAMLVLTSAVERLSGVSWEGLAKAVVTLAGLVGAFTLLALASNLITPAKLKKIGGSLIAISLALMLFVPSIKQLSTISWEGLAKAGVAIYGLVGAFTILALASKLVKPAQLSKLAGSLIGFASAMLILATSIAIISAISWEGLGKAGVALAGLIGAFALVSLASKLITPAKLTSIGGALVVLSTAMLIFTISIASLSAISWDGLARAGAAVYGLVGAFTLLTLASKLITPSKLFSIATSLTILGAAMLIFTISVASLSAMSWEGLAKAGVAIYGLVGAFALLALATKLITPAKLAALSTGVLVLSQSMLLIALALRVLGGLSWTGLAVSLLAIAGAIGVFALSALLVTPLVPTMIALAGALLTLSGAIALLGVGVLVLGVALPLLAASIVSFGTIIVGAIELIMEGIGAILVGIVDICADLIVAICKLIIRGAPSIGMAIASVIVAACVAIVDALPAIGKVLTVLIAQVCLILVDCVPIIVEALLKLVIGVLDQLAQYVPTIIDFVFNLLLAVLGGIANNIPKLIKGIIDILGKLFQEVLNVLGSIDPSVLIEGLLAVGILAGIMAALGALASMVPAAMMGVVGMGIIAVELAAVLAVIGQLTKIPGLMDAIADGGNFLQAIGVAIGQFVGGILGGIAEGATSTLPSVGTNLSNFMTNAKPFFDGLVNIDGSTVTAAKSLADVILAISGASIVDSIASWFTGGSSIEQFATDIVSLGAGIKGFSDSVTGVKPEEVTAAANAAKALAEMTNTIPNSGGVVSWFAGDNSISKFAGEIPLLGYAIKAFSDSVTGTNPEQVTAAANAAKTLAEMTNTIPNSGGVTSWFAGDNSISKFAMEIALLGSAIKSFSDESTGVNPEQVQAAANAAKTLAEMTEALPDQGGVVAWFAGESSISKYATQLPTLGRGLKGFSTAVSGINPEQVTAAANAAKALAEMTEHIPKEGGIKAWFTGETSVSNFADKLPALGEGIKGFSNSIDGIVPANVESAANAAKALAEMTDTIPKNLDRVGTFGDSIQNFGPKLAGYFRNTNSISEDSITNSNNAIDAVKKVESLKSDAISGSAKAIDAVTKALKNMSSIPENATSVFVTAIEKLGKASTDSLLKSFEDLGSKLKDVATKAMEEFVNGLKDKKKKSSAEEACESMVTACADAMKEKQTSFYNAGSHLVSGFANGISENSYKAAAKARAMAKAAAEAAEEELDINSPSKVFYGIGDYSGQGFVNALDDYASMSYNAGSNMADSARKGLSEAIRKIGNAVNGDMDMQPTIRPVLDLSDVKAGAGLIGNMLSGSQAVGVLTNVGAINSMMNQRNQNGANDDVVTEISKLRKDFANSDRATYNINGITITGDDEVEAAFETLLRAAKIGGRM